MKLFHISQPLFGAELVQYDAILVAAGYESRARHVAESLSALGVRAETMVALGFVEHISDGSRKTNDELLRSLGYDIRLASGSSTMEPAIILSDCLDAQCGKENIHVMVDISSMTRPWCGSFIRCLKQRTMKQVVTVDFAYTAASYVAPPTEYPPNRFVGSIPGFTAFALPDKPTALIIGLGYDPERALGVMDHLDPQLTLLFYADPSGDPRYVPEVLRVNKDMLDMTKPEQLFTYPLTDCVATFKMLESISAGLMHEWRVVLCSLGPKLFGLSCFLLTSLYDDLSIWRVSADSDESPLDREPSGPPILFRTVWS